MKSLNLHHLYESLKFLDPLRLNINSVIHNRKRRMLVIESCILDVVECQSLRLYQLKVNLKHHLRDFECDIVFAFTLDTNHSKFELVPVFALARYLYPVQFFDEELKFFANLGHLLTWSLWVSFVSQFKTAVVGGTSHT